MISAVQWVAPGVDSNQVLEAIDRGCGAPGDRFWTLDPVDGTRGFVRGDQYVVALALIVRGQVQIGVLGCPQLSFTTADSGSLLFAVRDRAAFRAPLTGGEFTPLRVSSCREPRLARVLRSVENEHIDVDAFNTVVRTLGVEAPPLLMDSQAKHAAIAAGQAELFVRLPPQPGSHDKIWDHAAGTIIVEEAGGKVTDVQGAELDFSTGRTLAPNYGVVASNGLLHSVVIEAVRGLGLRRENVGSA